MPAPGEHKTVQGGILAYAQEIGWTFVPRAEAEARRGFDAGAPTPEDRARTASLYFGDLLDAYAGEKPSVIRTAASASRSSAWLSEPIRARSRALSIERI
jgi:hypothetical protein